VVPSERGAFAATVEFSAGDGTKVVTATQPGSTAAREFVRITPIKLRGARSTFQVSAGFMVNCELNLPRPEGLEPGDVLLGAVYTDGGGNGDIVATGFTPTTMDTPTYSAFWKIATANEPVGYKISIIAGTGPFDTCESAAVLVAFSGVKSPPIAIERWQVDSDDATVVAPAFTAPTRGVLVAVWAANGPQTGFSQTGMTVAGEAYSNGDFASVLVAYEGVQAGPTGDRKATLGVQRDAVGALFLLDGKP
jgi:hypothetical protein